MSPARVNIPGIEDKTTVHDRAVDAVRQASHLAHEARLLKTLATDAVEDGVRAAKRTITRGVHEVEDLRDATAHRIRRTPLAAVGIALGVGMFAGLAFGWMARRCAKPSEREHE